MVLTFISRPADGLGVNRQIGKEINFAVAFGVSEYGLQRQLAEAGIDVHVETASILYALWTRHNSDKAKRQPMRDNDE